MSNAWGVNSDSDASSTASNPSPRGDEDHPLHVQRRHPQRATANSTRSAAKGGGGDGAPPSKYVQSFLDPMDDLQSGGNSLQASPRAERSGEHPHRTSSSQSRDSTQSRESPAAVASATVRVPLSPPPQREPPESSNTAPTSLRHTVQMEYNDEYVGEVVGVAPPPAVSGSSRAAAPAAASSDALLYVPHGSGTLQSSSGKHCYIGNFAQRERHGDGKLLTDRYVLWCRWASNRPDFGTSARMDVTSGDKYFGYLASKTDNDAVHKFGKQHPPAMSKFSMWVNATSFTKERWGELVSSNGCRYFGQWTNDKRNGFGCVAYTNGDRYVGMFQSDAYHGPGVLFSHCGPQTLHHDRHGNEGGPTTSPTTAAKPQGWNQRGGGGAVGGVGGEQPATADWHAVVGGALNTIVDSVRMPPSVVSSRHAVVYDGTWNIGTFEGIGGQVTFPCGTRVCGTWRTLTQTTEGQVVCSRRPRLFAGGGSQEFTKRWTESYHWEPLLCGSSDNSKQRSLYGARSLRNRILKSRDRAVVVTQLNRFLKEDTIAMNGVKVFRRCFYFFFGTCGASHEIGGGLAGNPLGWCQFRSACGGCIHRGRGRQIHASDVDAALTDIFSMVASLSRWTAEILGDAVVDHLRDVDAETAISRMALDLVMQEVHPVLINLYVQVYRNEEESVQIALLKLKDTTLDDLGVVFGRHASDRLFDPYADAARSLGELSRCRTLTDMIRTLVMWSREIDTSTKLAQVSLHEDQLKRISNVMRERRRSLIGPSGAATAATATVAPGPTHVAGPASQRSIPDADDGCSDRANTSVDGTTSPQLTSSLLPSSRPSSPVSMQLNNSFATPRVSPMASFQSPSLPPVNGTAGDDATLLPSTFSSASVPAAMAHGRMRRYSSKFIEAAVDDMEAGSADDLIPIHQYVLIRGAARVDHLYAITKLLVDLSVEDSVVDSTSQDSFCITTLHACVTTLTELDPAIRDLGVSHAVHVMTPLSVFERRLAEAAQLLCLPSKPYVRAVLSLWLPLVVERLPTLGNLVSNGVLEISCETALGEVGLQQAAKNIAELLAMDAEKIEQGREPENAEQSNNVTSGLRAMLAAAQRLIQSIAMELEVPPLEAHADPEVWMGTMLGSVIVRLRSDQRDGLRSVHKFLIPLATNLMAVVA